MKKISLIHRRRGVYYHYQFIYLNKLTNTKKRLRVENRALCPHSPAANSCQTRSEQQGRNANAEGDRHQANAARAFFCLQEESGTAETGARKIAGILPTSETRSLMADCRSPTTWSPIAGLVCQLICMQTDKFSSSNACQTASSVEKRLHIHSSKCAETPFLEVPAFLSKFRSAWIQCFSSASSCT